MAGATITTFDAILKEFYLGPIQEQLNNEIMVLQMFQKATVDWNGKVAVMPVHLGRNSGVEWANETDNLPAAGNQTYDDLRLNAQFLYGRFMVTGPAIASAGKGGTNSFIGYVDAEMNRLVDDVKNVADRDSVSGGTIKGFIPEYFDLNTAGADPFTGSVSGIAYDGDFTCFSAVDAGTVATWVRINLLRGDTLDSVTLAAGTEIWVKAANSAAGTIDIYANSTAAATPAIDGEIPATGDLSYPLVVQLSSTAPVNEDGIGGSATVAGNGLYVATQAAKQAEGMFGNLANPTHFSIDRSDDNGTAANTELQSTLRRGDITQTATAGVYVRPALTLLKIQGLMDEVILESGAAINMIIMNPRQRQMYVSLLQGTSAGNLYVSTDRAAKGDGGFLGLSYGGVPIQVSRHVGNGLLVFLDTKTWKILELQAGQFADLDGAVLSRKVDRDQWEGFYRWYWNIVCQQPNRNAILCGVKLAP